VRLAAEKAYFYDKDGAERGAAVRALMQELILVLISTGSADLKVPICSMPGLENLHGLRNVRKESVKVLSDPDDEAVVTLADGNEIKLVLQDGEKSVSTVMRCITSVNSTLWIFEQNIYIGLLKENNVCDFNFTHSVSIDSRFSPQFSKIVKACSTPA
jgi:hypothetical protein